ncbi:aminoacyl-tRNA hydrolase [Heyndrickxia acidiproducens]|uniref:aminoacyl-tRNA hydrolase n=1 Tax=Heyndrickxia acidiproducens TaxID=1121084 RepID=UPI000364FCE4|nr:aminoacyl-tRNA hydrolase [Heyndrickxia acidiproducens]
MKCIVGLGNPGAQYQKTRHNIGFEVVERLSERFQAPFKESKFKGMYAVFNLGGEKVLLLKPLTYMNLSGESIRACMDYYHIPVEDLLVIYDDLDLPAGKIRLRQKGSAGGHNGIKSTIAHIGTQQFNRIRIGIGRPEKDVYMPDYVLGKFSKAEWEIMQNAVEKSADACEAWISKPFIEVMNDFN